MKHINRFILILTGSLLLLIACSSPLPTPTPVPDQQDDAALSATEMPQRPTATPLAAPLPTATARPLPRPLPSPTPSAGYYRNAELGISFFYPESWRLEETGGELPAAILYDNDDPVQLLVASQLLAEEETLEDFADIIARVISGSEETPLQEVSEGTNTQGERTLTGSFSWFEGETEGEDPFAGQFFITRANGRGIALLLTGRPEIISTRPETFNTMINSLAIEQPEFFGVSRENGLVLLIDEPQTLDPVRTSESASGIIAHIFSGLIEIGPDLTIEPGLAESWEISDGGQTLRFTLFPDLVFHSGAPLDAAAVVASFERAQQINSPESRFALSDMESVTAEGDQTVIITLDGPKPYVIFKLALPAAAVVNVENAAVEESDWWKRPDGSGRFSLRRWSEGEVLILDRVADHPTPALVDTLTFLPFGESGLSLFEAKLVDVAGVSPFNLARVLDPTDPLSANLTTQATLCTQVVTFDSSEPPFDDAALRLAFTLAINQPQLAEVVLKGSAAPAAGLLPPGLPGYRPRPVIYDSEQAQQLIGDDLPADVTLVVPADNQAGDLTDALIDMWQSELGITVEVVIFDTDSDPASADFDLLLETLCAPYPDPEGFLTRYFAEEGPFNSGGFVDSEVDQLLTAGAVQPDPTLRLQNYQDAEDQLLTLWPAIPLVHPNRYLLIQPYVNGYQPAIIDRVWAKDISLDRQ